MGRIDLEKSCSKVMADKLTLLHQENDQVKLSYSCLLGGMHEVRCGAKYEFRISKLSHLRQIQTSDLGFD